MRGLPGHRRAESALRDETKRDQDARAGEYEGVIEVERQSPPRLEAARAHRDEIAIPAVVRAAHQRIDDALARAAAAATAVYKALFEAAGGTYHAESDP